YDDFDLLDVMGPLRFLADPYSQTKLHFIGQTIRNYTSDQQVTIAATTTYKTVPKLDILFIPGGLGTDKAASNPKMMKFLKQQIRKVDLCLSVCTGAVLVAK